MLRAWLDFQRATFARKLHGLDAPQLAIAAAGPSSLSLLGLLRHHTEGELLMFRGSVHGEAIPPRYGRPGAEFAGLEDVDPVQAYDEWLEACADSRAVEAAASSLDVPCRSLTNRNRTVSLRWMMIHAIEEYARHNGHADLLRERIDGATGF